MMLLACKYNAVIYLILEFHEKRKLYFFFFYMRNVKRQRKWKLRTLRTVPKDLL